MSRRSAVGLAMTVGAVGVMPRSVLAAQQMGPATPFLWAGLVTQAQNLSRRPYVAPATSLHAAPDYDAASRLTYGQAQTVAGNVRLLPTFRRNAMTPVRIAIVERGQAREITDTTGLFANGGTAEPAGFRVLASDGRSDWLSFQSASYFRSSGSRDQYGISARGIAIDTGLNTPEEFPNFTHFWLEQTGPDRLRVHALLDGPSVTGAYQFDCAYGKNGVVQDVTMALFMRKDVRQLGIAAASSMFWYDQSRRPANADWRPEIHDSDGLAIHAGNGERIWRPLNNPSRAQLNAFHADSPKGFGLCQRDQNFDHYQDDGLFYERRPSLWVEPKGDWGPGAVYLFEMPTQMETDDNIASFWRGDRPAKAGERRDFAYTLTWTSDDPSADANARCVNSFTGPAGSPGLASVAGARKFVFDFAGPALAGLGRGSGVSPATDLPEKSVLSTTAYPVAGSDSLWRVMLDVRTQGLPRSEFRLYLKRGDAALSETVIKAIEA